LWCKSFVLPESIIKTINTCGQRKETKHRICKYHV